MDNYFIKMKQKIEYIYFVDAAKFIQLLNDKKCI